MVEYNRQLMNGFITLKNCSEGYLPREIDIITAPIKSMEFLRNYVSKNIPVVIKGTMKDMSGCEEWHSSILRAYKKNKMVSVGVSRSPIHGGVVTEDVIENGEITRRELFLSPDVREMTMREFLNSMRNNENAFSQLSEESSNIRKNVPEVLICISGNLGWADEAFGHCPYKINLQWKDPAIVNGVQQSEDEYLIFIVRGKANYCLYPPTDRPRLLHKKYKQGKYVKVNGELLGSVDAEFPGYTKTCVDEQPVRPFSRRFPHYKQSTPLKVSVNNGDIIYIPRFWFFKEESSDFMSVKMCYLGDNDIYRAYYKLVEKLCEPYVKKNDAN